ncbi:MAG TPA: tetratricopeptide repeat protein [Verrucomicrobiae bacterium]|nr:tetratricopeptide repeat protein [Verrucomicrobiae bacterium]
MNLVGKAISWHQLGWRLSAVKKPTSFACLLAAVALFASCTPADRTHVGPRSQQLAGESAKAFNTKDYATAQSLAARATATDPQFAEAWVGYGMASVRLGQSERARQAYERALSIYQARHRQDPSAANPIVQQIFLLTLLDRPAEAETLLKQARADYPNDPEIAQLAKNPTVIDPEWKSLMVNSK